MRRILFVALLLAGGSAFAANESAVKVSNHSAWEIHQMYFSPVAEEEWGPDQLGDEIIATGGSFTLHGIPCGEYDVRLVDEDEDECVVNAVPMCADNDEWVISDDDLLACQAETGDE